MKKILIVLLLASALLLTGCAETLIDLADGVVSGVVYAFTPSEEAAPDVEYADASEPSAESSDTSVDASEPDESYVDNEPKMQEISSLVELRDYINGLKADDVFEIDFKYVGDIDELDGVTIARIATACSITYTVENRNEYHLSITEYPGDRIVDAYRSGDTSALNDDELEVLDVATRTVNDLKRYAEDDYRLEVFIHDVILDNVTYLNGTTDVDDPMNPPRHLTAVGALLDGYANCQGYTDAFYTLASIAGFEVGRMTVENADGGHIVNTILIDGEWYVVDTTFDDAFTHEDGDPYLYYMFNAGRDVCIEYEWGREMEYYPISDESDEYYYYSYGSDRIYDDIDAMAQDMFDEWYYNGSCEVHAMLADNECDWLDLSDAFDDIYCPSGAYYEYTIWTLFNGRDTYFVVQFE